ncbi:DUF4351 domain-containing protein, partial [Floridanema evergladense]
RYVFGELPEIIVNRIEGLSTQQLEDLAEDLFEFSELADLEAWLGYPRE